MSNYTSTLKKMGSPLRSEQILNIIDDYRGMSSLNSITLILKCQLFQGSDMERILKMN